MLVKPQFEAGQESVGRGGLVRDPGVQAAVIRASPGLSTPRASARWTWRGPRSPGGEAGNREYPLHMVRGAGPTLDEARILEVVGGG